MSASARRRYALDRWVRRCDGGRLLVGGAPGRLVRLSGAGARALDQLLAGDAPPTAAPLRDRLRGHGMLHPVVDAVTAGGGVEEITFVIPNRDGGADLADLVAGLHESGAVIVVDDGSRDGSERLAAATGAEVITNTGRPGPAGARNTGLAAAGTELVAFVDADCRCPADWALPLVALLDEEPELALVAPRVRSAVGEGLLASYERGRSPLDMGPDRGLCGPGRRVPYVPSAALVVRRTALLELGGFDEELRHGEDVDLIWRAVAAGRSVRYAPEVEVEHLPRRTLGAWARQRFDYGSSAAALARRHPEAAAPLRLPRSTAAGWVAAAAGRPALAAALWAAPAGRTIRRQPDAAARTALGLAVVRGQLQGARQLARAIARDWLPLAAAASAVSARARHIALLALAADAAATAAESRRRPAPAEVLLGAADRASYAAGLWSGVAAARSPRALVPLLSLGTLTFPVFTPL